ncbi:MAG TPA: hypothetical protein VGM90_39445 [Kofleriaceae bacterium]
MNYALLLLAVTACGRIGFDPGSGNDGVPIVDGECVSHDERAPSLLDVSPGSAQANITLCPGLSFIGFTPGAGSTVNALLVPQNVDATEIGITIRDPGNELISRALWNDSLGIGFVGSIGVMRTDGRSLLRIESPAAVATLTVTVVQPTGRVRWIDVAGDDSGNGEPNTPWKTWAHAMSQLQSNDTLIARDGTWNEDVLADCTGGAGANKVTILGQHLRKAHIVGDGDATTFTINRCTEWTLDGLHIENKTKAGSSDGHVVTVLDAPRFTGRGLLVHHPNSCGNFHGIAIGGVNGGSPDSVVEDSEVYDFQRAGFFTADSQNVTFRRDYANSRNAADDCGATNYPDRGDLGFDCYNFVAAPSCTFEDIVAENVGEGFSGASAGSLTVTGAIGIDVYIGQLLNWPTQVPNDRVVRDFLCLNCDVGVYNRGQHLSLRYASFIGGRARHAASYGIGILADGGTPGGGTLGVAHSLVLDYQNYGTNLAAMAPEIVDDSVVAQTPTPFSELEDPTDALGNIQHSSTATPTGVANTDGNCLVYIPATSSLHHAATDGTDIGANLVYAQFNATPTNVKLWDQLVGEFPFNPIVPGVNDMAGSLFDLHERLRVGVAGCAIP